MLQAKMVEPHKIILEEAKTPVPSSGQVLVAIKTCGICGSDILAYKGMNPFVKYPNLFGHELVGEIVEWSSDVSGMRLGERVAIVPFAFCGECYNCKRCRSNLCQSIRYFGGLATYIAAPAKSIVPIPDGISTDEASLIEPLAVGVHAASRANLQKGNNVLIFGAGAIGLSVLQVAKGIGANETVIVDLVEKRLGVAEKLGVGYAINANEPNAEAYLKELSRRIRIDAIFECTGAEGSLQQSVAIAEKGTRIVIVGTFPGRVNIEIGLLQYREIDIVTCSSYVNADFVQAVKLLGNKSVAITPILSRKFGFNEITSALDVIEKERDRIIKAIVVL